MTWSEWIPIYISLSELKYKACFGKPRSTQYLLDDDKLYIEAKLYKPENEKPWGMLTLLVHLQSSPAPS